VIFCGIAVADEKGKERKVKVDFEPFKPIKTPLYFCDDKFQTEHLNNLLVNNVTFGFIVVDGNGSLFGTVRGSCRDVLHKFTVDLPKKHGKGGQSAQRFARLRLEKRHNYIRKVAEIATKLFVPDGQKPCVQGVVLAGSADFKTQLRKSDLFDPRLGNIVIRMVDVSHGGVTGFHQAIDLSADALGSGKLIKEKTLLQKYFNEINKDTGKFCFLADDTFKALELGAVEDLTIWENLDIDRIVLHNTITLEETVVHLSFEQQSNESYFRDPETNVKLKVLQKESIVDWLANHYKDFGCNVEFVTDYSGEGK